jgi:hypothetical protein
MEFVPMDPDSRHGVVCNHIHMAVISHKKKDEGTKGREGQGLSEG